MSHPSPIRSSVDSRLPSGGGTSLAHTPGGAMMASERTGRTDAELVAAIRVGDVDAFEELFLRYHAALCSFAYHYVQSRAIAEEIAQDTLVFIWNRRASLDLPGSGLPRYLYASARNAAISYLRHRRIEDESVGDIVALTTSPVPSDRAVEESELGAAVRDAVAQLPERCRAVFVLHREQGQSYKEVAQTLGISPKTVEIHMGRAFKLLRKALAPYWHAR